MHPNSLPAKTEFFLCVALRCALVVEKIRLGQLANAKPQAAPPPCDIPSRCCSFTGPWTVTRSSLRMLRRVAAFCRPLRPLLLLVSFPRSRGPVVGVLGLCCPPPPPPPVSSAQAVAG